jgi:hypothetical protein
MRRLSDIGCSFALGTPIFLVTRGGEILEGFRISSILLDQVMLDPPPLGAKQGFTIEGNCLKPNWCAGRRAFRAAYTTRKEAEAL